MDLYTRCPHCQTVFRLASEQLDAAGGRVRCGACLRVFPARNSLVRPKTASAANPPASVAARPTPAEMPATPATRPASTRPAAVTPTASPAPAKTATPTAPELNFDSFFAPPPAAPVPAREPAATATPAPAAVATPAAAPTPVGQPDAPDFSLLSAALTEVGPLSAPPVETSHDPTADTGHDDQVADHETETVTSAPPASAVVPLATTDNEPATDEADFGVIDSLPLDLDEAEHGTQDKSPTTKAHIDDASGLSPALMTRPSAELKTAQANESFAHEPTREPDWHDDSPEPTEPTLPADDVELALELPADWASLKPKARTEPVFDDDNGLLDAELDALANARSSAVPIQPVQPETEPSDGLDWLREEPLQEDKPRADSLAADKQRVSEPDKAERTEDAWLVDNTMPSARETTYVEKTPVVAERDEWSALKTSDEPTPEIDRFASEASTVSDTSAPPAADSEPAAASNSEDEFEWHLDAVEAAAAEPVVFGDWQPDQSDTVKLAAEDDQLIPVRKTSAVATAATPAIAATERPAGKPRTQAGDPDLGEISSDWEQPPVAIQAGDSGEARAKRMSRSAKTEPEPFDQNAFTADPADRIYAPADADDGGDWTLTATEPPHDYESELYAVPKRRFPWRGLLGTVAALALLSVLVTQLLWPQRAALREDPQWGPWVEQLCGYLDCNLPPRTDLRKIELQQRSVLKDRDDPRKLQIDLLIANKAAFAQPYPDINLRFTNIEGELVAERRFKPSEYLREQPDSAEMPIGVPVHIAFSVKAPDGNITGYEFNFLPPQ